MNPTNVSAELVEVADLALATECIEARRPPGFRRCECPSDRQVRIIIAAVLGHLVGGEVAP